MRTIGAVLLMAGLLPRAEPAQQSGDYTDRVEIRRTDHGIPHIRATDLAAMGFGLAWVQLEDYGARIPHTLLRARGHLGRWYGRDSLNSDYG
ncbi:MAG: peptidase penicillin amidase, partial [Gemmatimonadetes bacterium]|nr:peptidase penicillin amidase [Gemmatimonadota bacterium]